MSPKHRIFLLLPLFFLLLYGCSSLGSFSFTEESEPILIEGQRSFPSMLPLSDLFPTSIPMEINLDQELAEQDASGARAVFLTELYLELTEDSLEENFDFLNRLTITVASRDSSSELPSRQLAIRDPVPDSESIFFLDVDDELDLKPYLEEGIRLRTSVSGSAPSKDAEFKVFATFRVQIL